MGNNELTIQSYEKIASAYFDRNQDRTRILTQVDRFAGYLKDDDVIIDVGCGPGFDTEVFRTKGFKAFAMDRSSGMISRGRQEFPVTFVQADMRRLPFHDSVDALWVNASLLHLDRGDVPATIDEFHGALKKNGYLFLSVKKGQGESWDSSAFGDSIRRWFTYWDEDQLDRLLRGKGFKIIESWVNRAPKTDWLIRICQRLG